MTEPAATAPDPAAEAESAMTSPTEPEARQAAGMVPGPDEADPERSIWLVRAERLLTCAIGEVQDETDALETISAAVACLKIAYGELPPEELVNYPFPGEGHEGPVCTCPAGMLARGAYRGDCPANVGTGHPDPEAMAADLLTGEGQ